MSLSSLCFFNLVKVELEVMCITLIIWVEPDMYSL